MTILRGCLVGVGVVCFLKLANDPLSYFSAHWVVLGLTVTLLFLKSTSCIYFVFAYVHFFAFGSALGGAWSSNLFLALYCSMNY